MASELGLPEKIAFNRDVRPILAENCFKCHGPDSSHREGKRRLDTRDGALADNEGVKAIVPGKLDASDVHERIHSTDKDEQMPPPKSGKKLTERQRAVLDKWIEQGGEYQPHWSYIAPVRPVVPDAGAQNAIDAFIRVQLAREGLTPSPEADRRTLIRRLCFDLQGLPPTVEEVRAFVADADPRAYEHLVDRLLASPRYAERMAVPWLDLARYADTIGIHSDNPVSVWPYRDYVLHAFATNLPFDQFTREQLAGDLIPFATTGQLVASGFNRLLRISTEGRAQEQTYLLRNAADRVRTVSTLWLGATLGCAECHDHKFDPYLTQDFYRFSAFFADLSERGIYEDGIDKGDFGPCIELPSSAQKAQRERLDAAFAEAAQVALATTDEQLAEARATWEESVRALDRTGRLHWIAQTPVDATSANGATLKVHKDGVVTAGGRNPDSDVYSVTLRPGAGRFTGLRLEVLRDENLPGNLVARGGSTFVLTGVEVDTATNGPARRVKLSLATPGTLGRSDRFPAMAAINGDSGTGWGVESGEPRDYELALRFAEALVTTPNTVLTVRLRHESKMRQATLGRFRLALHILDRPRPDAAGLPENILAIIRLDSAARTAEQEHTLAEFYRRVSPELVPFYIRLAQLDGQRSLLDAEIATAQISEPLESREVRVRRRGNPLDDRGEIVRAGVPHFFRQIVTGGDRANRLDLADWLTAPDNPLTARVFVNRLWRQFFGTGLVRTVEDFGTQGELPTHPELLDWLACEFMQPGGLEKDTHPWDIKHLIRTIVTSATYRQSSSSTAVLDARDPDNRWLARQSRFRLDAEFVRDNALAISGLLVEQIGGPSVHPYQPAGYWAQLSFPKREYTASRGRDLYRRGLYTHWQRSALHPSLLAFDAPGRDECTPSRTRSSTPMQALVLLNDPIHVEAARKFAERIATEGGAGIETQICWAWECALARPPESSELGSLCQLHARELERFRREPAAAAELLAVGESPVLSETPPAEQAALTSVARAILNLHETITRE